MQNGLDAAGIGLNHLDLLLVGGRERGLPRSLSVGVTKILD